MHLVQIFLPLYDNKGRELPRELYGEVRRELVERFGGLTAFTRAPVTGLWEDAGETVRDELVIFEVMVDVLEPEWWSEYRAELECRFQQEEVVVRAQEIRRL